MRGRLLFLGSGSSGGVPSLSCLIGLTWDGSSTCKVCLEASQDRESKNLRGNVSVLLSFNPESADAAGSPEAPDPGPPPTTSTAATPPPPFSKHVLIDCGKTFRTSVERFFRRFNVTHVDAVVLTHEHADAVLGLDDLRDVQASSYKRDETTGTQAREVVRPIDIYCGAFALSRMTKVYPYLTDVDNSMPLGARPDAAKPKRYVAKAAWHVVYDEAAAAEGTLVAPFEVAGTGLYIRPIELFHGRDYICLGFLFGPPGSRIAYLSDVSAVPSSTKDLLLSEEIDVLVVDALLLEKEHSTHFNLPQALDLVRELRPRRAFLVGMTHQFDYAVENPKLLQLAEEEGIHVEMAFDGLSLEVDL